VVSGEDVHYRYEPLNPDFIFVLDFEASCDKDRRFKPKEIIEFAVVVLDARSCEVVDTFHRYVKPTINPILTAFCTNLTGVTQEMVQDCPELPQVMAEFNQFQSRYEGRSWIFATCGDWDLRECLYSECRHKGLTVPTYYNSWLNVKVLFPGTVEDMPHMLAVIGLALDGRHHSGIDDARNIAKIVATLLKSGAGLTAEDLTKKSQNRWRRAH
jgi:inhibitor of KinA sporulation pathway (predicted exonuclease)